MPAFTSGMREESMKYQYCFLDLDGTLTDPAIGITNSVMYALAKYDIHVTDRTELYKFIGPPLDYSFKNFYGFTEDEAVQAVKYYREYFSVTGLFENQVYDGIPAMLEKLKEKGTKICLATSKPYEFSIRILKHFDLYKYFDFFGAATMDGSISKKEDVISHLISEIGDIDKDTILMVGDRHHDIDGAKANELKSAGVLWGFGSEEELRTTGADYLISRPEEILGFF